MSSVRASMRESDLLGFFGLSRAVLQRARSDLPVVVAAWFLLVCATTMLAATALYADTVAVGAVRQAVAAAEPAARGVEVGLNVRPAELDATDRVVRPLVVRALASVGGPVARVDRADPFTAASADPATTKDLVALGGYEAIADHARLVSGRWAGPGATPVQATVSADAAAALHVAVGDRVPLVDIRDPVVRADLVVVGVWEPSDRDDGYWLGNRLDLQGTEPGAGFTTRGPFVVAPGELVTRHLTGSVSAAWRATVPTAALDPDAAARLSRDVTALQPALTAALPRTSQPTVATGLPPLLDLIGRSIAVSRSSVLLLTLQFAVLAAYAVLLVAGMLLERRRAQVALLRSRGASTGHLVSISLIEAVVLAVPAVVIAPALALGIVRGVATLGPAGSAGLVSDARLGMVPIAAAIVAGVGCVIALVLPTLASGLGGESIRAALGRPLGRTLAQRAGLDLVLVVVAAIALWQLRLYGAPLTRNARGALGADPLLVAAPAVGLVAGGVLAVRVLPRAAEIAERLLSRARGLMSPLGSRQLARRPLRYTRSALLLMLAVALGTFAAAYGATWSESQSDQATYRAAADARLVASDYPRLPAWASASVIRAAHGVTAALPVTVSTVDVTKSVRDARLMGVDARALDEVATADPTAGAATDGALARLAAERPTTGIQLPGTPRRLRLTLDADLAFEAFDTTDRPETFAGLDLAVVVADGTGRLARIAVGSARFAGRSQSVVADLATTVDGVTATVTPPLRLQAVEIAVNGERFAANTGSVTLREVAVSDAVGGRAWSPVALDPGAPGWQWLRVSQAKSEVYRPDASTPLTFEVKGDDGGPLVIANDVPGPTYRLWDASVLAAGRPVAAIAGQRFLDATGTRVGDTVTAQAGTSPITLRIAAAVDVFAPLDPAIPFLVVDGPTLDLDRFAAAGEPAGVSEWWLRLAPDQAEAVKKELSAPPVSAKNVIVRDEVARSLSTDPVSLGVIGALGLGAVAAVLFAAIGFLVNATVATAERLGELAVLRALGMSGRQLIGWLSIESAILLLIGVVGGAALGSLLAWLVLPFASLTATGVPPVPAPVVVVPFGALLPVYALTLLLFVASVALATRQVPSAHAGGVLRASEE